MSATESLTAWSLATNFEPRTEISRLGILVIAQELRHAYGYWVPSRRMILVRSGLGPIAERSVLAHELAHAILGHGHVRGELDKLAELDADLWAFDHLASSDDLRRALAVSSDWKCVARALGMTGDILDAGLRRWCSMRLKDLGYIAPPPVSTVTA